MFMNELEATKNPETVSPLSHDLDGRFSRCGTIKEITVKQINLINTILVALYCVLLLSSDFILFAGSGNIEIFRNSVFPVVEVSNILLGFFVISAVLSALCYNHRIIRGILPALITFFVVTVLFNQFSTIDRTFSISVVTIRYAYVVATILSVICFLIMYQKKLLYKILLVIAMVILFLHIYIAYMHRSSPSEFLETTNVEKVKTSDDNEKSQRFIYFMLPNLTSLSNLSSMESDLAKETRNLILGFYQKNGFTYYSQAFLPYEKDADNIARLFNPTSNVSPENHMMQTQLLFGYWRFHNMKHERILLKDNSLYDSLKDKSYTISAYKSRDFDMCYKQHNINVYRCTEKVNKPANIYDMDLSRLSKTNILLIEWLAGTQLFKDMSPVYKMFSLFNDADHLPMVGINYNNLYVMNSIRTFDILSENIKKDSGKQAYFVFMDMPSDMYIYDEYCRIKPTEKWVNIANMPWIEKDNRAERQEAYLQQSRCLYGQLEQFMSWLKKEKLLKETTIVVQGMSGVNNFYNKISENYEERFINNRLVTMAIYDKKSKYKAISDEFCSTNGIFASHFLHEGDCHKSVMLGTHEKILNNIKNTIKKLSKNFHKNYRTDFEKWYESWLKENSNIEKTDEDLIIKKQNILESQEAEDSAEASAEEKEKLKVEDSAKASAEEKENLKAEDSAKLSAEEKENPKAEDSAKSSAEEKENPKAEDSAKSSAEEKEKLKVEDSAETSDSEKDKKDVKGNKDTKREKNDK